MRSAVKPVTIAPANLDQPDRGELADRLADRGARGAETVADLLFVECVTRREGAGGNLVRQRDADALRKQQSGGVVG